MFKCFIPKSTCIILLSYNLFQFTGDVGMDGPTMVNQVMNLAQQLKFLDPMYTTREGEASEMGDPQWITDFTNVVYQINSGSYSYQGK